MHLFCLLRLKRRCRITPEEDLGKWDEAMEYHRSVAIPCILDASRYELTS